MKVVALETDRPAGFWFSASCPFDGSGLLLVAPGTPRTWVSRTCVRCTRCGSIFVLQAELVLHQRGKGDRHTPEVRARLDRARAVRWGKVPA